MNEFTKPIGRSNLGALVSKSVLLEADLLESGASPWVGHVPFAFWIIEQLQPRILVELGTHYGHSYFSFCQSVRANGLATKCYAVDTWQGDEHAGFYGEEVFAHVEARNQRQYHAFSRLLRMRFDEALAYFSDGAIDLLHIDGLHTYEAVRHDFETWLPKLSSRGVVLFHDINVRERGFGVWRLWEELSTRYPHIEFEHSHGLGVLFIGGEQPPGIIELLEEWTAPEGRHLVKNLFAKLGHLVGLEYQANSHTQAIGERDGQIAGLNNAVAEREAQLISLNQGIAERDGQVAAILSSKSWRLTKPMRLFADQLKRIRRWFRFTLRKVLFAPKRFDAEWYLKQNPDVAMSGMDPYKHYILFGKAEGRQPAPEAPLSHSNKSSIYHLLRIAPQIIAQQGGIWRTCAKALSVYRREGFAGIKNRIDSSSVADKNLAAFRIRSAQTAGAFNHIEKATVQTSLSKDFGIGIGNAGINQYLEQLFVQARRTKGYNIEYVPLASDILDSTRLAIKLIAFYLPQFHPIPENDHWWGKGFTEWTNVSKAVPQFVGHYQPRLPGELGFYDLRLLEVQKRQIELAKQYGIYGFCFHTYWFGGKRLLEKPVQQFLEHPELDYPFCLCWANENWTRRWDGLEQEILMEQRYSPEDDIAFIRDMEKALRDPRYIRVDGRPLLIVYRASVLPDAKATAQRWRNYCISKGIGDLYLIAARSSEVQDPRIYGCDAAVQFPPLQVHMSELDKQQIQIVNPSFQGRIYDYRELAEKYSNQKSNGYVLFKTVVPGWDNVPRRPEQGHVFHHAKPEAYAKWLRAACMDTRIAAEQGTPPLVFVNAWNEWAEGAYLEPDRRYGYAYLQATRDALEAVAKDQGKACRPCDA